MSMSERVVLSPDHQRRLQVCGIQRSCRAAWVSELRASSGSAPISRTASLNPRSAPPRSAPTVRSLLVPKISITSRRTISQWLMLNEPIEARSWSRFSWPSCYSWCSAEHPGANTRARVPLPVLLLRQDPCDECLEIRVGRIGRRHGDRAPDAAASSLDLLLELRGRCA